MILVIDIGNTNVKIGAFDGEKLVASFRFATSTHKTADEYGVSVRSCFDRAGLSDVKIDGVILSSVIPGLNYTFEHMCKYYFGMEPIVVSGKLDCGLTIAYDNPAELGADRIATSLAAVVQYGGPVIVIDFGTATTFNVVSEDRVFLGGLICPGIRSSSDSMVSTTAKLPRIELVVPETVIGTSTVANMQNGLYYAFVGMVEHIVSRIKAQDGLNDAKVIATGGLSELLKADVHCFDCIDRELSLKGLRLLYHQLKKTSKK